MQEMEEEEEIEELTIIDDPFALVDSCSEASEDPSDADSSFDLRSPDPFDYMPTVRAQKKNKLNTSTRPHPRAPLYIKALEGGPNCHPPLP